MSKHGDGLSDGARASLTIEQRAAAITHGPLTCRYMEEMWEGYTGEICAGCKYVIGHIQEAIEQALRATTPPPPPAPPLSSPE